MLARTRQSPELLAMTEPRDGRTAKDEAAARSAAPATATDKPPTGNNANWDADEEPWRHPPVAPNDESPAKSLGRSVSDAVVSAADAPKDKTPPKPKP
jgi:hypothetical protein